MSEKITTCISVWLDEFENGGDGVPKWIVSRDKLFESGRTDHTQTLQVFNDYENAVFFAKSKAHELELSVYATENTPSAKNELILGVYHAECESGDFGITTFFADNFEAAKELAIEWTETGEWDEDDEVTVDLSGPDGDDSFIVQVIARKAQ